MQNWAVLVLWDVPEDYLAFPSFTFHGSLLWDFARKIPVHAEFCSPEVLCCNHTISLSHFSQDFELQSLMFALRSRGCCWSSHPRLFLPCLRGTVLEECLTAPSRNCHKQISEISWLLHSAILPHQQISGFLIGPNDYKCLESWSFFHLSNKGFIDFLSDFV